ncbi:thioether cross-link-forming SCIFF peptide maturase [Ammonifex thiophilus]|uniref:Thioether cross-link-forming SCIFF peptide maturase n=1 Tax=Ammonifex thiophilus TaxID=444093 RepID=A0A3D8P5E7_9THEO|nr:thioether cross-link-forming SCIFF peptide maturase [Ammonifex thiophilus]RDV84560.1 thioether cross-link-forming SCIFF peptide maturase [Ammonifex thiophilus]
MVHLFCLRGEKLAFDPVSGSLHQLDEAAWRVLSLLLEGKDPRAEGKELEEACREVEELRSEGLLFTPDHFSSLYEPPPFAPKSLCLMVAQACNLRCSYCFAGEGDYGAAGIMPEEVARAAVDFLLESAGPRRAVEIDFFGGEPLLNFPVVVATVRYGKQRARELGKEISFTLTTNAVLLDEEKERFLLEEEVNLVLSLDGRPEVHDRFRRFPDGTGSYQRVLPNIRRCYQNWASRPRSSYCYLRGTFTRMNLDFSRDFKHLVEQGFRHISLEPVVAPPSAPHALREEDLPRLLAEYEELLSEYLERWRRGEEVYFFHFELDPAGGPCLNKRLTGCGAGFSYVAVDVKGDLYPCHQFVGKEEFRLGSLKEGLTRPDLVDEFRHAHIYRKTPCSSCWARFLCGGGCHAAAYFTNDSLLKPYSLGCALMRRRLECALYALAHKKAWVLSNSPKAI